MFKVISKYNYKVKIDHHSNCHQIIFLHIFFSFMIRLSINLIRGKRIFGMQEVYISLMR